MPRMHTTVRTPCAPKVRFAKLSMQRIFDIGRSRIAVSPNSATPKCDTQLGPQLHAEATQNHFKLSWQEPFRKTPKSDWRPLQTSQPRHKATHTGASGELPKWRHRGAAPPGHRLARDLLSSSGFHLEQPANYIQPSRQTSPNGRKAPTPKRFAMSLTINSRRRDPDPSAHNIGAQPSAHIAQSCNHECIMICPTAA